MSSSKRRSGPAGLPDDFAATPDPKRRKRNDVSAIAPINLSLYPFTRPTHNQHHFPRSNGSGSPRNTQPSPCASINARTGPALTGCTRLERTVLTAPP